MQRLIPALIILFAFALTPASSCKTVAHAAARYWTKRQIKEFINNCEAKSSKLLGDEKAKQFCDCAVDAVSEQYQNYNETKTLSVTALLEAAQNCGK
ncbi:MAG: hypothetical protein K2X48_17285 [Chitinophagaceae bacterium]|nr:hypothetical protein [Chitinophagaceae bacterium]